MSSPDYEEAIREVDALRTEVERLRGVLKRIVHREHLFAKAHVEVRGKVDTGACAGCLAEAALND